MITRYFQILVMIWRISNAKFASGQVPETILVYDVMGNINPQKNPKLLLVKGFIGGPTRARTLDPLIMSQVL